MIHSKKVNNVTIISFNGMESLDAQNAFRIKGELKGLINEKVPKVVLNLKNINFIDSSGFGAIISALKKFVDTNDEITIYSDSKNTVSQLNHDFAINSEPLKELAREAWPLIAKYSKLKIVWIPRKENLAGKMLGS